MASVLVIGNTDTADVLGFTQIHRPPGLQRCILRARWRRRVVVHSFCSRLAAESAALRRLLIHRHVSCLRNFQIHAIWGRPRKIPTGLPNFRQNRFCRAKNSASAFCYIFLRAIVSLSVTSAPLA